MTDFFAGYPRRFRVSTAQPTHWYSLMPGYYAVHDGSPGTCPVPVSLLEDGRIAVCKGQPDFTTLSAHKLVTPVYQLNESGTPSVPTGLVLVRFNEGVDAQSRLHVLQRQGYDIAQTLPYASHAVWVKAASGDMAAALTRISDLESLQDVVNVEPQLISQAHRR